MSNPNSTSDTYLYLNIARQHRIQHNIHHEIPTNTVKKQQTRDLKPVPWVFNKPFNSSFSPLLWNLRSRGFPFAGFRNTENESSNVHRYVALLPVSLDRCFGAVPKVRLRALVVLSAGRIGHFSHYLPYVKGKCDYRNCPVSVFCHSISLPWFSLRGSCMGHLGRTLREQKGNKLLGATMWDLNTLLNGSY